MTDYTRQLPIRAVWLKREGDDAVVCVETPAGRWVEIIRERIDGSFSHICEAAGIWRQAGGK